MHDNRYLVLESPDETIEACINLKHNDVVNVKDKTTGKDLYKDYRHVISKILDLI